MLSWLFSVVGDWNSPFNATKVLPVTIPVVFAPPTFTVNVCPIPVNSPDISSNTALVE